MLGEVVEKRRDIYREEEPVGGILLVRKGGRGERGNKE